MKYKDNFLLIEGLRKGDEKAYINLVVLYKKGLFGYALSLTKDHEKAQDILQNVFLKTWEKRKKIKVTTSLQNYLFKSVFNEFINQRKKNQSTIVLEQKYFQALEKAVHSHTDESTEHIINQIASEIQNLPPKCKQIFILSKKEGLTNKEISAYLNVSIKTVEGQITKAFRILRKQLSKHKTMILMFIRHMRKL